MVITGLTNPQLTAARNRNDIYIIAEGDDTISENDRFSLSALDNTAKTALRTAIRSKFPNVSAADLNAAIKDADCLTIRDVIRLLRELAKGKRTK